MSCHYTYISRKFGDDYRWVRGTGFWSYFIGEHFVTLVSSSRVIAVYNPKDHTVYTCVHRGLDSTGYRHKRDFWWTMTKWAKGGGPAFPGGDHKVIRPHEIKIPVEQLRHMVLVDLPEGFLRPDYLFVDTYG